MIYLDNNATTPVAKEVIDDVVYALTNIVGNPSSQHQAGFEAKKIVEESRAIIAQYINAEPEEIIFTSGGTESNNLAIQGYAWDKPWVTLLCTNSEHPSVLKTIEQIPTFYQKITIPVTPSGEIDLSFYEGLVSANEDSLSSIMLANNETGVMQDIKALTALAHEHDGIMHTDATQAFGHIPIDVKDLGVDMMTVGLHKCALPKGIGFLYIKNGISICPIMHGGHQERELRPGTENVAFIYAAGQQVKRMMNRKSMSHDMLDYLSGYLKATLGDVFKINSNDNGLPTTLSLTFDKYKASSVIGMMDGRGFCISAGSACSSGIPKPSKTLIDMGLTEDEANRTIRVGIDENTTVDEIRSFVGNLHFITLMLDELDADKLEE